MAKPTAPRQWNSTLPQRKSSLRRSAKAWPKPSTDQRSTRLGSKPPTNSGTARSFPAPNRKSKQVEKSTKEFPKRGKKTREWEKVRAKLKTAFEEAGITRCEIGCTGCWRDDGLGFAHSLKRRDIKTMEQMLECALACNACHDVIEAMPHARMADVVRSVIARRPRLITLSS